MYIRNTKSLVFFSIELIVFQGVGGIHTSSHVKKEKTKSTPPRKINEIGIIPINCTSKGFAHKDHSGTIWNYPPKVHLIYEPPQPLLKQTLMMAKGQVCLCTCKRTWTHLIFWELT